MMFTVAKTTFPEWLKTEMAARAISQAELARLSGFSGPHISMILNEQRKPGPDFLDGVARALRMPPETVYREAGLLPPEPESDPITDLGTHLLRQLPAEERERFVEQMRAVLAWQEAQKRKPRET